MHVTIVEDEVILGQRMVSKLKNQWYIVSIFESYSQFMRRWDNHSHLYVIDIWLWDGSGFDIIEWLRKDKNSQAPILITSGYWETEKIVYGLNIGADDYMIKPCIPDEFIARVNALTRRQDVAKHVETYTYKDIVFFPHNKEVRQNNERIALTQREAVILGLLIQNQNIPLTREKLIEHAWWSHNDLYIPDGVINTTLSRLRKKFHGWLPGLKWLYNSWYILE